MRGIKNYKDITPYTDSAKLPAGAYKVKILRAEEQSGSNGSCALCILFDIAEGEYANFYMSKFQADKKDRPSEAKYKGVYRLWYPNGGQYDESNEKRIKTALENISESNSLSIDFSNEWDGAKLKGCYVGMVFQEKEWAMNGNTGFTAQPYRTITLEALKEGKFTIPAPKLLNPITDSASAYAPHSEDLPF